VGLRTRPPEKDPPHLLFRSTVHSSIAPRVQTQAGHGFEDAVGRDERCTDRDARGRDPEIVGVRNVGQRVPGAAARSTSLCDDRNEFFGHRDDRRCSDRSFEPLATRETPDPHRSTIRILARMTTPVPTRFSDDELALLDRLVGEGVGESRSAVVRRAVAELAEARRRVVIGSEIVESYQRIPQSVEDDESAMASANALSEAEPW